MDVKSDIALPVGIARLHASDEAAWKYVIQSIGPDILAFLKSRSFGNAEDLSQTVWLKALNSREQIVDENLRPWLFSIARHLLIDEFRKKRPEDSLPAVIDLAGDNMDEPDPRIESLRECMKALDERCRRLIQRFYLDNVSTSDLASELGIAEGTISSGTSRCRQKLRDCIENKMI
jgi:RNA polymerase sigma-70 factor (ECF subfamily)